MQQAALAVVGSALIQLAIACQVQTAEPQHRRSIPDDNLSEAVLITLPVGNGNSKLGSGFYLDDGTNIYLVTAKHVLFNRGTNTLLAPTAIVTSYDRTFAADGKNVATLDLTSMLADGSIKLHRTQDVCVVRVGKVLANDQTVPGRKHFRMSTAFKSTLVSKIGFLTIPIQQAKPFSDVLIGNDVIVFGYPNSVGIPQQSDIDREKPLVRRGIIAGKNEKEKRIILDCPIYQGNSGGPAVQVIESWGEKRFEIIGVVVAFIPLKEDTQNVQFGYTNSNYSNTGLSVALPMDFVFELLD